MIHEIVDEGRREPDQDGPLVVCCIWFWVTIYY
jgi:hypothetical protein